MGDLVTVQTVDTITNAVDKTSVVDVGYAQPGGTVPTGSAGGDLSGTFPSPTVTGAHLASALPIAQGGTGNTTGQPSGTATGDLSGSYPSPAVAKVSASALIGLQPSGDTTGATDTAAIQALLNAGAKTVRLGVGKFYLNAPLAIPPYCALVGAANTSQVTQTDGGTTLAVAAGFTGKTITDGGSVTLTAAIVLLGQTFGGYSTVSEEQKIRHLMIDGTSGPASVNGIQSYGRLQRVHLTEVLISKMTGDGLVHTLDASGNQPDAWFGYKVFSRFNTGKGFSLRSADSTWYMCLTSNNGDTGADWFINTTSNSKYYACRSEHSAGIGFGFVCTNSGNSSGDVLFQGCSTDQSTLHGFQIGGTINSVASFVHATPVILNGCVLRRDGANGGSGAGGYAGIYIADYGSVVVIDGCNVFPGVNDDGSGTNSPQIGLLADSGSLGAVSGSYFHAATTAISDAAGLNYDNTVITATGTTGSPAIVTSPDIAAYQGASLTLTPGASPAADPLSIVSAGSGQRAFGMKVTGDSSDRVKWTSDGQLHLGPGNATQDVTLLRSAAGLLATDTSTSLDVGLNALNQVQPRNHGLAAWTFDPALAVGNLALTNGSQYLNGLYVARSTSVTSIWFYVSTAAGAATTGQCLFGVVDSSGNLLQSVDVSSLLTSTGLKQATITSQALTPGKLYWVVAMANCSGSPSTVTLRASSLNNITLANVNQSAATSRFTGCGTAQTSLANFPVTPSSNTVITSQQPLWFAVS